MKTCTGCGEDKPLDQFFADRRKASGKCARCKTCSRDYQRVWRARHPEHEKQRYAAQKVQTRERHLKRKYGVTLADYEAMFERQGGACAICRRTQQRAFDVDHDHATGRVRGLLCTSCNRMVGHAGDSPETLEAAAAYLRIVSPLAAEFVRAWREAR